MKTTKLYPFSAKHFYAIQDYANKLWEIAEKDDNDSLWNYACNVGAVLHQLSPKTVAWLSGHDIGIAKEIISNIEKGIFFPAKVYQEV